MTRIYADRVKETTTVVGTGTMTLLGAVAGFQSFATVGNGNTCTYEIDDGTNWEVGIGTYTSSGTTLSRTTILSSSTGSAISFGAGTKSVFLTLSGTKVFDTDSTLSLGHIYPLSVAATGDVSGSSLTTNGNLEFTGSGDRILGNFTANTGVTTNTLFQSTAYSSTILGLIPGIPGAGSTTGSSGICFDTDASLATNSPYLFIMMDYSNGATINTYRRGSGIHANLTLGAGAYVNALLINHLDGSVTTSNNIKANGNILAVGTVTGSNLSGTNTGDQTNISGNAATVTTNANLTGDVTSVGNATTLAISGVTAGTYGQVTVDTKGRATAGTVAADATHGGTAQTTYTTGDILYASATNTLSKLAIGSSTNVLTVSGGVPVWATAGGGGVTWATNTTSASSPSITASSYTLGMNMGNSTANTLTNVGSTANGALYIGSGITTASGTDRNIVVFTGNSGSGGTTTGATMSLSSNVTNNVILCTGIQANVSYTNSNVILIGNRGNAIPGPGSVSIGSTANSGGAPGTNSIAIGTGNNAVGTSSIAIGYTAYAIDNAIAISASSSGVYANQSGQPAIAIVAGTGSANAKGLRCILITAGRDGAGAGANIDNGGTDTIAIGGRPTGAISDVISIGPALSSTINAAFGTFPTCRNSQSYGNGAYASSQGDIAWATGAPDGTSVLNIPKVGHILGWCQTTTNAAVNVGTNDQLSATFATVPAGKFYIDNYSAVSFEYTLVATRSNAANATTFSGKGLITRGANAAATALVGTPTITQDFDSSSGLTTGSVAFSADTTNGSLQCAVTGVSATNIRWYLNVKYTKIGGTF